MPVWPHYPQTAVLHLQGKSVCVCVWTLPSDLFEVLTITIVWRRQQDQGILNRLGTLRLEYYEFALLDLSPRHFTIFIPCISSSTHTRINHVTVSRLSLTTMKHTDNLAATHQFTDN